MSTVEFPPAERVRVIGDFTRGEVIGAGVAIGLVIVMLFAGSLWPWVVVPVLVLVWTFAPNRRRPLRVIVPAQLRWLLRSEKVWSRPVRGRGGTPRFLRGVDLMLAPDLEHAGATGVVVRDRAYTVVFPVSRASLVFASDDEQREVLAGWGEVLGGLCVERGTELTAEWVGWTDVHRAADPSALTDHHRNVGVDGPATGDYDDYLSGFGQLAAEHQVLVWATITQARRFRLAKQAGFTGSRDAVMAQAALSVGRTLKAELSSRGFDCGELLSPAELGRVISAVCDPYSVDERPVSARERFGLPGEVGPDRVDVARDHVAADRAFHRVFAVSYPRTAVDGAWMWRPLSVDGPKVTTSVFEGVAPSHADRQREANATRGQANNEIMAAARRGRVRDRDRQKVDALMRAERAVSAGHQELDGYTLMVVTGRSREELDQRCQLLRQRLRESGRANVREMTGEHDDALAAALPIGIRLRRGEG